MPTLRRGKGTSLTWDELDDNFAPEQNQTSHGFAVGDLIYRDSATTWAKAIATSVSTLATGVVVHVEDANNFSVLRKSGGMVPESSHGFGGFGTLLYLSQGSAGDPTATKPTSGHIQPVGIVEDANNWEFRKGLLSEFV